MEERRAIGRVGYSANAVIVVCDTQEKYYVHTENVSPLGMALRVPEEVPDILGKDIILVADTLIMYADVTRQEKQEDGSGILGIAARKSASGTSRRTVLPKWAATAHISKVMSA